MDLAPALDAFRDAATSVPSESLTACTGFTAHDVIAHVVAAAAETSATLEAAAEREPIPATRAFDVREAPYRALDPSELLEAFDRVADRMIAAFDRVLAADAGATVVSAGIPMPVAGMVVHKRSELALHRWDLVGDDDTSTELLAQPELTAHAVRLGHLLVSGGPALFGQLGTRFEARLRAVGTEDVVVVVDAGGARLERADDGSDTGLSTDAAARLLLLWGRRPGGAGRVRSTLDVSTRLRLFSALRGF